MVVAYLFLDQMALLGGIINLLPRVKQSLLGERVLLAKFTLGKVPCWPIDTTYYVEKTKVPCDFTWLYYILLALDLDALINPLLFRV